MGTDNPLDVTGALAMTRRPANLLDDVDTCVAQCCWHCAKVRIEVHQHIAKLLPTCRG